MFIFVYFISDSVLCIYIAGAHISALRSYRSCFYFWKRDNLEMLELSEKVERGLRTAVVYLAILALFYAS
ncbi:unnamed protein product [Larinioides sclopetarius]|uniref:Uncharacterized protein n=1 Tax=Larinioides sclopetarius TaxID=280406 RepID=A0AAV2B863_9ARAC